jgi:hypothetical protein
MVQIAVVNQSSLVSDDEIAAIVPALQRQVSEHFSPLWGIDAGISTVQQNAADWLCFILDDADQANALGYHDITAAGQPIIKIFARDSAAAGVPLSSVISHEILEELADPWIDGMVLADNGAGAGRLYATEVCDPVEADLYEIDGVQVSNFVSPLYFMQRPQADNPRFDWLGKLAAPFSMTPGGYLIYQDAGGLGGWQQQFADKRAEELAKLFGSR